MNETANTMAINVEKEEIARLNFPKKDVLDSDLMRKERNTMINKAMRLGNAFKRKVKIIFEDAIGLKAVETTIWGVTEKNILLKRTMVLPIRCIHEIKFY